MSGVSVLMYHDLYDSDESDGFDGRVSDNYTVSFENFKSHIYKIVEQGYEIKPLLEIEKNSEKTVGVTFDDGHASDYLLATSFLSSNSLSADFFINTATVGKKGIVSWDNLREMSSKGMSIQSHSHEHTYLTKLSNVELKYQLTKSKQLLEDKLGKQVDVLSAPGGRINNTIRKQAFKLGYRLICDSRVSLWNGDSSLIPRVPVYAHTDIDTFNKIISGDKYYYFSSAGKYYLKYMLKKITGDDVYEKIRIRVVG